MQWLETWMDFHSTSGVQRGSCDMIGNLSWDVQHLGFHAASCRSNDGQTAHELCGVRERKEKLNDRKKKPKNASGGSFWCPLHVSSANLQQDKWTRLFFSSPLPQSLVLSLPVDPMRNGTKYKSNISTISQLHPAAFFSPLSSNCLRLFPNGPPSSW